MPIFLYFVTKNADSATLSHVLVTPLRPHNCN